MYKFTEREKVMLIVLAFFLLIMGAYYFLINPALRRLNDMRDQLVYLEDDRVYSQQLIMRTDVMQESYEENTALIEATKKRLYLPMDAEEVDKLVTSLMLENGLAPEELLIDLKGYEKAIQKSMDASEDGQPETINTFYTVTIAARGSKQGFRSMIDAVNALPGLLLSSYTYTGVGEEAIIDMVIDIYIYDEERLSVQDAVIGAMVEN